MGGSGRPALGSAQAAARVATAIVLWGLALGIVALPVRAQQSRTLPPTTPSATQSTTSTPQVDLKVLPVNGAIAPGQRFSVAVQVTPKPGMHVYAPGAKSYKVVTLTVTPQSFLRALPMTYPASEIWFFKPLNERVPVYEKPFTLVQPFALDGQAPARASLRSRKSLTVAATLNYQACDERLCYNPVSVPLTWAVELRPTVTPATVAPPR